MSAALSYSSGESATPLLGDTIGGNFDATVLAFADREALVDRSARAGDGPMQNWPPTSMRWRWDCWKWASRRATGWYLGAELRGMDSDSVRDRQDRRDPG